MFGNQILGLYGLLGCKRTELIQYKLMVRPRHKRNFKVVLNHISSYLRLWIIQCRIMACYMGPLIYGHTLRRLKIIQCQHSKCFFSNSRLDLQMENENDLVLTTNEKPSVKVKWSIFNGDRFLSLSNIQRSHSDVTWSRWPVSWSSFLRNIYNSDMNLLICTPWKVSLCLRKGCTFVHRHDLSRTSRTICFSCQEIRLVFLGERQRNAFVLFWTQWLLLWRDTQDSFYLLSKPTMLISGLNIEQVW